MSDELKDILSNSNKDIDNQQLMDYLSKQLNKTEQHEVEKTMLEDEFTNDAVEGLQNFTTAKDIRGYVDQLNDELRKKTEKKKRRKERRKWKDQPWTYVAIVIILLLLFIGYIVIKKYRDALLHPPTTETSSVITKDR